jgi:hypothetical protein
MANLILRPGILILQVTIAIKKRFYKFCGYPKSWAGQYSEEP